MKLFLQRMKKFFSIIFFSSKDAGKIKIAINRKISTPRVNYSFCIIIESKEETQPAK
jgi:hypothetical protein